MITEISGKKKKFGNYLKISQFHNINKILDKLWISRIQKACTLDKRRFSCKSTNRKMTASGIVWGLQNYILSFIVAMKHV